jgi:hypothetical protein
MSKDSSLQECQTDQASSGIASRDWRAYITKLRQEYSRRAKSAHRTSESVYSSWPTANARDWKDSITGTHPPSRPNMSEQTLGQAVSVVHGKDAANWPTPAEQDGKQGGITPFQAKGGNHTNLLHIAAIKSTHGQAAPASSSSLGSRQESWPTLIAGDWNGQVPSEGEPRMLSGIVEKAAKEQWATPRAGKTTDENPETWAARQAKGDVATMPLTAQVKCWGRPTARDHKSGRGNEDRQYKELTPMVERTQAGKLNPRWVETFMGLPVGWVMPSCASPVTIEPTNCGSWEMVSSLPQQNEHSES